VIDDGGIAGSQGTIEKQSSFQERLLTEFVSTRGQREGSDQR
jgi:hypothetical protein